jgi:hypothetical protein
MLLFINGVIDMQMLKSRAGKQTSWFVIEILDQVL